VAGSELQAAAERALALAGGQAIATARHARIAAARVRRGAPAGARLEERLAVEVIAIRDGHVGRAVAPGVEDGALRAAAGEAAAAAAACARTGPGPHPGPPPGGPPRPHEGFDPALAAAEPAALLAALAATGLDGELVARARWTALASSAGIAARDATTEVGARLLAPGGGRAAGGAVGLERLELGRLAAEARARGAGAEGGTTTGAPGPAPVAVLAPEALGALLRVLGATALNGLRHAEGDGALAGRLGSRVAAACVNLSDSPRYPGTLARAFDAEGVPKAPRPLIQDGVAHGVVHDARSAALAGGGARSTGHALVAGGAAGGPEPRNLVLVGGGAADEHELVAGVERGVFVAALRGVRVVDPRRALVAGVPAGVRAIAGGRLGPALGPLVLHASLLDLLDGVEALAARPRLVGTGARGVVCPAARVAALPLAGAG
jgi:predicted Zn-dependent protease